mgnify:CR=1 FL=1
MILPHLSKPWSSWPCFPPTITPHTCTFSSQGRACLVRLSLGRLAAREPLENHSFQSCPSFCQGSRRWEMRGAGQRGHSQHTAQMCLQDTSLCLNTSFEMSSVSKAEHKGKWGTSLRKNVGKTSQRAGLQNVPAQLTSRPLPKVLLLQNSTLAVHPKRWSSRLREGLFRAVFPKEQELGR